VHGYRLIVDSVHARSGCQNRKGWRIASFRLNHGGFRSGATRDSRERSAASGLCFALPGDYALPAGDRATFRSAAACPKTNIWHFNGCGSESSDGHAYDTGFFSSTTKGHTVSAALPPALAEQMQIYQEMKQMADAFKTMFGREGPGVSEVTSSEVCVGCLFFKDRAPDGSFF